MEKQKVALRRLHLKIIEVIRELDSMGEPFPLPMNLETTNHNFQLDYDERRKQFRLIVSEEEED